MSESKQQTLYNNAMADIEREFARQENLIKALEKKLAERRA